MTTIIKLNNGVEVVGEIEVNNANVMVLNKPLQINYKVFFGSTPSVSFTRYIMFAESESVVFDKRNIMNEVQARESFADYYKNVVNQYYSELEQAIDRELDDSTGKKPNQENQLRNILENISIEDMTVN